MRKFLIALALLLSVTFVLVHFAEVQNIAATLQQGHWGFLLLGLVVEACWIIGVGASFKVIFEVVGIPEKLWNMVKLSSAANFFNIIAPSGGFGGLVILFASARRKGYSSARATVSGALFVLFDYAGFLVILALGLGKLIQQNQLGWPETTASLLLLAAAILLAGLLYLGTRSARLLGNALARLASVVNWVFRPFIHRDYLSVNRAHLFAQDAADGISMVKERPRALLLPLALALANKSLLIAVLFLVFLAFQVPFTPGILVAGFSMGYLFLIVSPTPAGLGVVEGMMTIYLHALGVPLDSATVVVLAYRGLTFWVPFFVGMLTFRSLTARSEIPGGI